MREVSGKMPQTRWIPRPRPTLCASLRSRNALGHATRATSYGNLKMPSPEARRTLGASLRNRNALGHFTRGTLCGNLHGKCRAPERPLSVDTRFGEINYPITFMCQKNIMLPLEIAI